MGFDLSCPDWVERLEAGRTPIPDLDLDLVAATRAVEIYNRLRLPDVPGQPSLGEAGGEWFRDLVRAAFGSTDPETGEAWIGEIFCLVPKKNSKTTNSAALGLVALLLNSVPNAQMLIVGPTKDVADTCFSQMTGMILAEPIDPETGRNYLADRFQIRDHLKEIHDRRTGATLSVRAYDKRVVTGTIPILVIIDELHVLGQMAGAADVLAQIRGGMITRPNSLLVTITTQSDKPPTGIFKTELDYARRVRDGEITDTNVLACLYEFPPAIQVREKGAPRGAERWRDPALWPMVLPNLGRSITLPRLQMLYEKAAEKGEADLQIWASQHLNIEPGLGLHADAWPGAMHWEARARRGDLAALLAASECVTAGIDGGGLDDLMALALIGRLRPANEGGARRWWIWARAWAQPEVWKRRKGITPELEEFARAGDLVRCTDPTQDIREIAEICDQVAATGLFPAEYAIGLDPFGVTALQDELNAVGLVDPRLVNIGQGAKLAPALWGAERKLADGTLWHCDQGLMDWAVGNVKTEQRGSAIMATKAASGKAKIDPFIAAMNAFVLMSRNPTAEGAASSPWDDPNFSLLGAR